ncbi:MAG: YfhO family protein [Magnetococcus sp. THC-1_WYH]
MTLKMENRWKWVLFWSVWSLIIASVYWLLGPYAYVRIRDAADSDLPLQILASRNVFTYGATFWNHSASGGFPVWISQQVDSLLWATPFAILPPWAALGMIMVLQRFVAGYFFFLLFRRYYASPMVSLFGGILFSLNSWNVDDWRLIDALGLPATPMFLYFFARLLELPSRSKIGIRSIVLGMCVGIGASAAYYTTFLIMFLPLWFLLIHRTPLKDLWLPFLLFSTGAVLVEAPEVIALMSYAPYSARFLSDAPVQPHAPPPVWETWTYFGQMLPGPNRIFLVLAMVGMIITQNSRGLFLRSTLLLAICLFSQPGLRWFLFFSGITIPFTGIALDDIKQFTFITSVAVATIGLHMILVRIQSLGSWTPWWKNRATAALLTLYSCIILINTQHLLVNLARRSYSDNYHVLFENPALKALAEKTKNDPPFRVATLVAKKPSTSSASGQNVYPNYSFVYGFQTVDGFYRQCPQLLYHYWLRVTSKIIDQRPQLKESMKAYQYLFTLESHGFNNDQGMIPVANPEPIPFADWYRLNLLSLSNTRFIFSHWPIHHPELQLIHDPVQEKEIRKKWAHYRKREMVLGVLQGEPPPNALYIYENRSVLPRAFLVGQVKMFPDQTTLLDALQDQPRAELAKTAFVQPEAIHDSSRYPSPVTDYHASVSYPRPDQVIVDTEAKQASILILTDNYDPNWRAWVDGVEKKLFPVDYLYRGIELDPGKHHIVMKYSGHPTPFHGINVFAKNSGENEKTDQGNRI